MEFSNLDLTILRFKNGMHYLLIDKELGQNFIAKYGKRLICNFNNVFKTHSALMSKKEEGYYITVSVKTLKTINLKEGDKVSINLIKDNSSYQFNVPDEFAEVLRQDELAEKIFNSLTEGNKRGLLTLVNKLKSIDKRIERSLIIASKLKIGITSPRIIMESQSKIDH